MIAFADSIKPELIPGRFTHVAAYPNGQYAWPSSQVARFAKHFEVAVEPGQPEQAKIARAIDCERYDATVADVAPFCRARHALGHDDALIYESLSIVPDIVEAMAADLSTPWHLWVAWWWGRPFPPAVADIVAELQAMFGAAKIPPGIGSRIAACQWRNTPDYDESAWYLRDTFTAS